MTAALPAFSFAAPRPARRPSLTPMIDVVFLLLVFFMLAARFGQDTAIALTLPATNADIIWEGPPRLITLEGDALRLNGVPVARADLASALAPLMEGPDAPILLRAQPDTALQNLVDLLDMLNKAGLTGAVLVE